MFRNPWCVTPLPGSGHTPRGQCRQAEAEETSVFTRSFWATDGSKDSARAAEVAVDLSQNTGSELHVVYVGLEYYLFAHDYISPAQYERLERERQEILDRQVESIEKAGGSVTETHLRIGRRVDEEVVNLAEELAVGPNHCR